MGEGRHGRARRGKGREGAKNDASASLSAKAAAWFLTRMAESHPPLLCSVALLHSTPLSACLPALQGHGQSRCDTRFLHLDGYHRGPTTVPLQYHACTHSQPRTVAPLHCLLQEPQRNRIPNPSLEMDPRLCKTACLWEVCAPKQYCNHHTRT
jgi:hypothetical protein